MRCRFRSPAQNEAHECNDNDSRCNLCPRLVRFVLANDDYWSFFSEAAFLANAVVFAKYNQC